VQEVYLPNCALVATQHELKAIADGFIAFDHTKSDGRGEGLSDADFAQCYESARQG
jgi:hypothetical protein